MTYKNKIFNSMNVTRDARSAATEDQSDLADLMANPEYLRYSSSIINDALKDGFDVLQLPNGDIVTTGTKIITNTYVWDASKSVLAKTRPAAVKKPSSRKVKFSQSEEE